MIELPRGVWRWLSESSRDLSRIASTAEAIAKELRLIREALEDHDDAKEERE